MVNMNKLLKQFQKTQAEMMKAQEALKEVTVETTVGGGAVRVVATCDMRIKTIEVKPEAVDPDDVEMLQDLILSGVNQALEKANEEQQKRMAEFAGGIPGLGL